MVTEILISIKVVRFAYAPAFEMVLREYHQDVTLIRKFFRGCVKVEAWKLLEKSGPEDWFARGAVNAKAAPPVDVRRFDAEKQAGRATKQILLTDTTNISIVDIANSVSSSIEA